MNGHLGDTGQVIERHHIADHEDVRCAGERQIPFDSHPARAVDLGTRLPCHDRAEWARRNTCRPDLARRFDATFLARFIFDGDPAPVHSGDHGAELDLYAEFLQSAACLVTEFRAERGQYRRRRVEKDHAGRRWIDTSIKALEGISSELGNLARHLHTGRSRPDDNEREKSTSLYFIVGELGLFERAEDAAAQLESIVNRLHAGRVLLEMIVAEVRLVGAGRENQAIEARLDIETAGHVLHLFRRDVDVGDISEHDLHILEVPENETRRRSDLADRQDARGHLIEKRLEEVMAGLCDERDIDVLVLELAGREKPTEPGSDDHDVVPRRGTRFSGGGVARSGYGHSSLLGSQ